MNRRTLLIGASALGLVAFGGGAFFLNRQRQAEAEAVAATTPAVDPSLLIRPHSPSFGPADAPVTLVEFFDPSCEACRAFHPTVMEIKKQFPTQVRVVLRYTVFHQGSDEAVRILEVARMQDKFEQVLDALLEKQPTWALHDGPQMDVAWRVAGAVGLDLKKAESDRLFPGIAGVLNQDMADVEAVGIRQTPTFFLDGKRLENVSPESLIAEVKAAVESV
ncbi:MAG: thioredoxin domain-containing protein [Gemmobacter sp.]|nr:thioredoxin domain-containing protein [Gemmobacter sp.]